MLVKLEEKLPLDAPIDEVWKLLRDTARLTALLPGVESVTRLDEPGPEAYAATISDRVGPFKVILNLEVRVVELIEPSVLRASLKGSDSIGMNHVTGSLHVVLTPEGPGTRMDFEVSVEVLGKLATLGAVPIRRKTTQQFGDFARNIQSQFARENS